MHDEFLLLTVLLYLSDVAEGGETRFIQVPGLAIKPVSNTLAAWANYLDDGAEDPMTLHEALAVVRGHKQVAIFLYYGDKSELPQLRRTLRGIGTAPA